MKLAIVTETFPPEVNGVAMTFGVIARELALMGHQLEIIRPSRSDLATPGAQHGYQVHTVPGFTVPGYREIRMGFPAWRTLSSRWTKKRPDLVHVVTEGPLGSSAITTARRLGIPVSSSFHTNFHSYTGHYGFGPLKLMTLAWLRRVHNRTLKTFAPTAMLCEELSKLGFTNMAVLSRGVDTRSFSPSRRSDLLRTQWGATPETPVVIHVGRMAPEKNYEGLFRVYSAMAQIDPRVRFVLAGEGPLESTLRRRHPECVFAGFFSREKIGEYYASADLYVHASTTETFGNVVTEAMASGLAVAAYDYAAANQFIQNGVNGLSVPLGDEQALSSAACCLLRDIALRDRLRRAAPASLASQSWSQVIRGFEAELQALAGKAAA